jgi:hypothetical protein
MRRTWPQGGVAAAIGAGVVSLTAAVALAVPPPPSGVFRGTSSQAAPDNEVVVRTDANGHVSKFRIQWHAKCQVKGKYWGSETTVRPGPNGLAMTGDVFKRKHTYVGDAGGGITGKITYTLKGQFADNDNASGTWGAKVIVKKNGHKIDTCTLKKITWSVARAT